MSSHVEVAASGTSHSSEDEAGRWREIARLAKRRSAKGKVERPAREKRPALIDARHNEAKVMRKREEIRPL